MSSENTMFSSNTNSPLPPGRVGPIGIVWSLCSSPIEWGVAKKKPSKPAPRTAWMTASVTSLPVTPGLTVSSTVRQPISTAFMRATVSGRGSPSTATRPTSP